MQSLRACLSFSQVLLGLWLTGAPLAGLAQEASAQPIKPATIREIEIEPADLEKDLNFVRVRAGGRGRDVVEFGHDVVIAEGEEVNDVVVIGGNAIIEGSVRGELVVVCGSADIKGSVRRDMVVVLGGAKFGPKSHLSQDCVIVGGPISVDPKASLDGNRHVVGLDSHFPGFTWLPDWVRQGLLKGRPFPPQLPWAWAVAGCMLAICLGMAFLFPRTVKTCAATLEAQPVASFFSGILAFILVAPVFLLLIISVAGILAMPFVICALVAALFLGKAAVYSLAGQQVTRQFSLADISLPVALLLGATLFYVMYMLPALGFVAWGLATLFGVGAAFLAFFRNFRGGESSRPVAVSQTNFASSAAASGFAASAASTAPATSDNPAGVAGVIPPPPVMPSEVIMLPRVGFWRRFFATFLDFVLIGLTVPLIGPFFLLLWSAYFVGLWTWRGTTIGGIVMGIKVVRTDGQPVDFAVALVRSLSSYFSAMVFFLGFFWAGWDRDKQAWHDKIAGTVVVKVPRGMSLI